MSKYKSHTIKDVYEYYKVNDPTGVDYRLFRLVLTDYYANVRKQLLSRSEELRMPYRLGTVHIGKYRPKSYGSKSLSIDFKQSNELGYKVYHLNDHSDGYKYRLFWHKETSKNFKVYKYSLSLVRAAKRELAHIIKNKLTDYPEL